jgi:hypothetical protein
VEQVRPVLDNGSYIRDANGVFAASSTRVFPKTTKGARFAAIISGAQRLPNGNTLITYGPQGLLVEVNSAGQTVWEYQNTRYTVRDDTPTASGAGLPIDPWWTFRSERYPPSYPGLANLER